MDAEGGRGDSGGGVLGMEGFVGTLNSGAVVVFTPRHDRGKQGGKRKKIAFSSLVRGSSQQLMQLL